MLLRTLWIASSSSSSDRLDSFLRTSKKGQRWIEQIGYDKSLKMMKIVGIPIGIIVPMFFIGAGIAMYIFMSNIITNGQI